KEWWGGQEKVVVKVDSLKEIEEIKKLAISLNVPWSEVSDAGHTQIEPGTTTCISLGPAPESLIDKITGKYKLL
ncbi:MAG: peptidyl-tRNA hydrolase, partial [Thermoproteota archaeon]